MNDWRTFALPCSWAQNLLLYARQDSWTWGFHRFGGCEGLSARFALPTEVLTRRRNSRRGRTFGLSLSTTANQKPQHRCGCWGFWFERVVRTSMPRMEVPIGNSQATGQSMSRSSCHPPLPPMNASRPGIRLGLLAGTSGVRTPKSRTGVRASELLSNWRTKEPLQLPSSSLNQRRNAFSISFSRRDPDALRPDTKGARETDSTQVRAWSRQPVKHIAETAALPAYMRCQDSA